VKKCPFMVAKIIHWEAWVVQALVPCADRNQRQPQAAKARKVLFAEKRKERLHGVMQ
jgi:hypothetical protein